MHGAEGENPLVGIGQFAQARVEQRLLAEGLLGQQVLAALGELDLDILHGKLDDPFHQRATGAGVVGQHRGHLLEVALHAAPERRQRLCVALDEEGEGVGDEIVDVLEVVGGGRQRHLGLGGHRAVAHGPYAVADDQAHGGIENRLAPLLADLAAGLAAARRRARGHPCRPGG